MRVSDLDSLLNICLTDEALQAFIRSAQNPTVPQEDLRSSPETDDSDMDFGGGRGGSRTVSNIIIVGRVDVSVRSRAIQLFLSRGIDIHPLELLIAIYKRHYA